MLFASQKIKSIKKEGCLFHFCREQEKQCQNKHKQPESQNIFLISSGTEPKITFLTSVSSK